MAFQPENPIWEVGVYQLETTDVVEGGLGGIDNQPLLHLANRTLYLKNKTDDLQTEVDQVEDDLAEEVLDRIDADIILQNAINSILPFIPVRRGYISGIDPGVGNPGDTVSRSGDFTAATVVDSPGEGTTVAITMPSISTTNYKVVFTVESLGTIETDHDCYMPVFKKISATQFQVSIADMGSSGQNLKIHMDVVKL